jgi:hypothetical protein
MIGGRNALAIQRNAGWAIAAGQIGTVKANALNPPMKLSLEQSAHLVQSELDARRAGIDTQNVRVS